VHCAGCPSVFGRMLVVGNQVCVAGRAQIPSDHWSHGWGRGHNVLPPLVGLSAGAQVSMPVMVVGVTGVVTPPGVVRILCRSTTTMGALVPLTAGVQRVGTVLCVLLAPTHRSEPSLHSCRLGGRLRPTLKYHPSMRLRQSFRTV